jgi:hypothetical protein
MGRARGNEKVRTDHGLPEASRAGVLRNDEVGLETHLTRERREHLAGLRTITGEKFSFEQNLEEDLCITGQ